MKRRPAIATPIAAGARASSPQPVSGNRAVRVVLMGALAAIALATGCDHRPFASMDNKRVSHCINRVCPITGQVLGSQAYAVPYRGYMIGVHDREASVAWSRLPDWQQQAMLRELTDHASEW